jgi:hypothetical protein
MPEVLEAQREYKKTDADALLMRFRARARLGRAVVQQLDKPGATIVKIAAELGVVDEQVRRYRQAYWDWCKEHDERDLD